jgi:hypothetical protein
MASRDPDREKHWQSVLAQWQQSGQTITAFCKQRHLSKPTFGYWKQKLGLGRPATRPLPAATFVPMTLVAEPRVEVVLLAVLSHNCPPSSNRGKFSARLEFAVVASSGLGGRRGAFFTFRWPPAAASASLQSLTAHREPGRLAGTRDCSQPTAAQHRNGPGGADDTRRKFS